MTLKHLAYRSLSRAARAIGRPVHAPGLRALMYHSVGGTVAGNPYGISIEPRLFAEHMRALVEAAEFHFTKFSAPSQERRELALTFDDGFRDTLSAAAPICQRLGLPMTVFVTPAHVRDSGALYLSPAELKELGSLPGVLIGAHGMTHRPLDGLSDEELSEELSASRRFLEDILGAPVDTMSYPHGRVDLRVRAAAAAAGYRLAGCSRYGLNSSDRDQLLLCRTEITAWDSVDDLRLKAHGHWDWFAYRRRDPAKC